MIRIVALVPAFNEEDIIVPSIKYLAQQGIGVYLLENWSTDRTYELAATLIGQGILGIERFPKEGPQPRLRWMDMLLRIEELAREIPADWFLLQGVDEIHKSPWQGINFADGVRIVDQEGYTCIDHAVMMFPPVDNGYEAGTDFEAYFKYFEWGDRPGQFLIKNGWKNLGKTISLAASAGHEVQFDGRRVYPRKFLLKHYPVRSQAQGERNIFMERLPRRDPEEWARGWNIHYDHVRPGDGMLRPTSELRLYDEGAFPCEVLPNGLRVIDWAGLATAAAIERKDQVVRSLATQIQESDAALNEVGRSAAWRLIEFFRGLRLMFAPHGSAREAAWYAFLRTFNRRGDAGGTYHDD